MRVAGNGEGGSEVVTEVLTEDWQSHRVVMRDYQCHRAASNAKFLCYCFCFGGARSTQLSRCQTEECEQCEVVVVVDYV